MSPLDLARAVAGDVARHGGRALVVGGFVRDRLLGRTSKDLDLEVFGVSQDDLLPVLSRFGRVETVGQSFPVYKLGPIDVALPRRESKSGRGHKGFVVQGDPSMTVGEAARRRDFTINAILVGSPDRRDPRSRRWPRRSRRAPLRVVDADTFADDSLRVLRALQFAARFELDADATTRALCRDDPLDDLPADGSGARSRNSCSRPRVRRSASALALDVGVVDRLWPEVRALVGCEQEPEWHPEGDVWVHTLMVIDEARTRIDDLPHASQATIMLGAVCHDFGKPATTAFVDGRIRSLGHEEAGVEPASSFLDRLNVHSIDGYDVRLQVLGLVAHHLKPGMWHKANTTSRRRCVSPAGSEGGPRAAGAPGGSRLPRPHGHLRLFSDGMVRRSRADAWRRARAAGKARPGAAPASARHTSPARTGTAARCRV